MKLEVERDALLGALRQVVDVVASRNTIPVLGNILLTAAAGELSVIATDLDIMATARLPAAGELSTTVDKNKLVAAVTGLKPGTLTIESDPGKPIVIRQGRAQRTLATLGATDFPKREALKGGASFRMPAASLARLFDAPSPAISSEETRYYLCGILLHVVDKHLRAVATDGHRMIRAEAAVPDGAEKMRETIVPDKTVAHMRKLLAKVDGEVAVQVTDKALSFEFGQTLVLSKVVDGTYPDYSRIIPEPAAHPIVLARDAFLEPIEAAAAVLNLEGDRIKTRKVAVELGASEDAHQVTGSDMAGSAACEPLDAEYAGPPLRFGLNNQYARTTVGIFAEDAKITLSIADPAAPIRITSDKDPDLLAVVMPMRV